MPTPPYAAAQASVNGGAQQLGGQPGGVVVNTGDSVALSPQSTVGWNTSPLWEIFSYPTGWAGPGGTWTLNVVTNAWENVNISPSAVVMPAASFWGDFLVRLTAGVRPVAGQTVPVDETLGLSMADVSGMVDVSWLETVQFQNWKQWVGRLQDTLRTIASRFVTTVAAVITWVPTGNTHGSETDDLKSTTTSDGANHVLDSYAIPSSSMVTLVATVMALKSGQTVAAQFMYQDTFKRVGAGAAARALSNVANIDNGTDANASGYTVSITLNSNTAELRVNSNGDTTTWTGRLSVLQNL